MKPILTLSILLLLLVTVTSNAQQEYTVNGQKYTLKTEVEGPLTLLWNSIDDEYRYFSKKGSEIVELKNTKQGGDYQEEYKQTLKQQTADATIAVDNVNLTLPSLRDFFNAYNKEKDPNFSGKETSIALKLRLGAFAGISNAVFTDNIFNIVLPVAGLDFEIMDGAKLKRHALVIRFKQTFENSNYKYSASQFSLNYRFKFVKTPKFDAFVNTKVAAFTISKKEETTLYDFGNTITEKTSGSDFNAPVTFGIGADYKVGNGYITFNYNDIVGLNLDSNGEFPVDFTVGYKFNL